jgi:hypothetical protein
MKTTTPNCSSDNLFIAPPMCPSPVGEEGKRRTLSVVDDQQKDESKNGNLEPKDLTRFEGEGGLATSES